MIRVLQNDQEFTKHTRQGRVLQKGNSTCEGLPVHGLTPFIGDPDSTGNSPGFKALLKKKKKKRKPNHNLFIIMSVSSEDFSTGCIHTIRVLKSRLN